MSQRLWSFTITATGLLFLGCGPFGDASRRDAAQDQPDTVEIMSDPDWAMAPDSTALAEHRLRLLGYLAWRQRQTSGSFPVVLVRVLPDTSAWVDGELVRDPWLSAIEYVVRGDSVTLHSPGLDRLSGTPDDLRILVTAASPFKVTVLPSRKPVLRN